MLKVTQRCERCGRRHVVGRRCPACGEPDAPVIECLDIAPVEALIDVGDAEQPPG